MNKARKTGMAWKGPVQSARSQDVGAWKGGKPWAPEKEDGGLKLRPEDVQSVARAFEALVRGKVGERGASALRKIEAAIVMEAYYHDWPESLMLLQLSARQKSALRNARRALLAARGWVDRQEGGVVA